MVSTIYEHDCELVAVGVEKQATRISMNCKIKHTLTNWSIIFTKIAQQSQKIMEYQIKW